MPKTIARITDGPAIKDGTPIRSVRFEDGSGSMQYWNGSKWVAGGTYGDLLEAPWMTREELARAGIPFEVSEKYPFRS